eukprot:TRINITY_DN5491_c0_g1_i2.p3 TRINITY_DN5491_c0_g1~~TRINITY_DN5491_c0_g1_i2.p3  ORF type:complete len:160 (+),score=42.41 TRINITY_DN5491_c0_g1_i2:88-567(+)
MIRRPPRSTHCISSAASDVYKRQVHGGEVLAVIQIRGEKIKLVELDDGLLITPNHPVLVSNKWVKPYQLVPKNKVIQTRDVVYNYVLSEGHTVVINGTICVTLGHGIRGQNIEHPYFGSKKIIGDIQRLQGWENGFVTILQKQFVRNKEENKVCGISNL